MRIITYISLFFLKGLEPGSGVTMCATCHPDGEIHWYIRIDVIVDQLQVLYTCIGPSIQQDTVRDLFKTLLRDPA